MAKVDEWKERKSSLNREEVALRNELEKEAKLPAKEGGSRASYDVVGDKVYIYGHDDKAQVTLSAKEFKEVLEWGHRIFG